MQAHEGHRLPMVQNCRNCDTPLGPDDKFCSECGTEVDASLELADESRSEARQPSLARDAVIYFVLAAASTLVADFIEVQLAPRASWDIESTLALRLVYASLATGVFVILCGRETMPYSLLRPGISRSGDLSWSGHGDLVLRSGHGRDI